MLKFKASNLEELQEEMNLRSHEVSTEVVTALCNALDNDVDYVDDDIDDTQQLIASTTSLTEVVVFAAIPSHQLQKVWHA